MSRRLLTSLFALVFGLFQLAAPALAGHMSMAMSAPVGVSAEPATPPCHEHMAASAEQASAVAQDPMPCCPGGNCHCPDLCGLGAMLAPDLGLIAAHPAPQHFAAAPAAARASAHRHGLLRPPSPLRA